MKPFETAFFCDMSDENQEEFEVMELGMKVMASYVTNSVGAVFLLSKCGFEDNDGMMEEIGKELRCESVSSFGRNSEQKRWALRCDEIGSNSVRSF